MSKIGSKLTPVELEVLRLISKGMTNEEISGFVFRAPSSIKSIIKSACLRLGAANRTHAVVLALKTEQIEFP